MNNNLNRYVYFHGKDFAGSVIGDEALGSNGMFSTSEILAYIRKGHYQPNIEDILNSFVKDTQGMKAESEKGIEGDWYAWGIENNVYPNCAVKTITSPIPSSGRVGENFATFTICVDKPLFKEKDILRLNSEKQLYVLSNAIPVGSGSGYNYEVRIVTDDPLAYLPPSDYDGILSRVVKLTTAYEKASYGNPYHYFAGITKYRVPLQIFRKSLEITGDALTREKMMFCVDKATGAKVWWRVELEKMMQQFDWEINNALLFQKGNARPDGTTNMTTADGKPVFTFDGIYEQVAKANYYSVPRFTLDSLTDLVHTILTATKEAGVYNLKLLALCGLNAFKKIQKALGQELNLLPGIFNADLFVRKSSYKSSYKFGIEPTNNLEVGWTYTKYNILGSEISFVHCPYFDSAIMNPAIDPDTGFPEKSNEILLLNMSDFDKGENKSVPNVMNLYREGNGVSRKMLVTYVNGMHSLSGNSSTLNNSANSFDGASIHVLSHRGVVVHYPYTCGVLSVQEPII